MLGFGMLGMICVPGMPRLMPLSDESGDDPCRTGGTSGADGVDIGERADLTSASTSAPPPESTLLVASGETWGPLAGSPTPGVVVASSSGTDGGGP